MRTLALAAALLSATLPGGRASAGDPETWEILARGPNDEPIPGVVIRPRDSDTPLTETDRDGRATLAAPADGGKLELVISGTVEYEWREVVGPKTVLRIADTIPVDVVVVDAKTGKPLAAKAVALFRADAAPFPLSAKGDAHRLGVGLARAGSSFWQTFELDVPGYAAVGGYADLWTRQSVAGAAKLGRVEIPAWPAGKLRVHVVDERGAPVRDTQSVKVLAGGVWLATTKLVLDDEGRAVVEDVPVIDGGRLTFSVLGPRRAEASPIRLRADTLDYSLDLVLPDHAPTEPGRCGGAFGSCKSSAMPEGGSCRLEIRALRHDGAPARRSRLLLTGISETGAELLFWEHELRTDDAGVALVTNIPPRSPLDDSADVDVRLLEPGVVPASTTALVKSGELAKAVVREPEGAEIKLTVVDDEGAAVPWARVAAERDARPMLSESWAYAVLDGDVQDLAPHTDLDGRYVFRNLPTGEIEVSVSFGERRVRAKCSTGSPAKIVLPR